MNVKLILSKCFSLIYRENELKEVSVSNKEFVLNTISTLEIADSPLTLSNEGKKLLGIRDLIVEMCRVPVGDKFDSNQKLNDLRIICDEETTFYDAVRESTYQPLEEKELNQAIISIRHDIINHLRDDDIKRIISQANNTLKYKNYEIKDMKKYLAGVIAELSPYQEAIEDRKDPAIVAEVNLYTGEGLTEVLREIRDDARGESILKFPWQCINRMTRGGMRRGQVTTVSALQHHNKSGFCLSSTLGFCIFNDPNTITKEQDKSKGKIPTVIYISFENEQDKVIGDIYTFLKENLENEKVDDNVMSKIQPNVIANYIKDKTCVNGYQFIFIRVNPSEWTYLDIFNKIISWENEGFDIHVCCIDYLNQIPKTGCNGGSEPDKIQDLFNRVRNFFSAKNIGLLTPHQLSSEALELHRQGKTDLALIVSDGNYYAGSKGLGREVDLELFLYLAKDSGRSYQCIARGKHRLSGITAPEHMYYILPFEEVGSLRWDINGEDTSLKKIGQKRSDDGALIDPFWG